MLFNLYIKPELYKTKIKLSNKTTILNYLYLYWKLRILLWSQADGPYMVTSNMRIVSQWLTQNLDINK